MDSPTSPPEEALILDAIRRIVRLLRLSSHTSQSRLAVSGAQLFVLQKLGESPLASIADLARRTLADPSSVSVVVAKLVQRGLVSRRTSKGDARRAELALTDAGRRLLRRAPEPAQVRLLEALGQLSAADRRALAKGLRAFTRALGIDAGGVPLFFEEESESRARPRD